MPCIKSSVEGIDIHAMVPDFKSLHLMTEGSVTKHIETQRKDTLGQREMNLRRLKEKETLELTL